MALKRRQGLERNTPLKRTAAMPRSSEASLQRLTSLGHRSAKMQRVYDHERKMLNDELRNSYRRCEMRPDCRQPAVCWHERWCRGRSGNTYHAITCRENLIASCAQCNTWAADNPLEALRLGLVRQSWEGCPCGFGRTMEEEA